MSRNSDKANAAQIKKQMDRMFAKHEAEMRVEDLAANLPEYREEGSTIEDRKAQPRKRRENTAAKKQAMARKASKARAAYDSQVQKAQNAGKTIPLAATKGMKTLEKRAKYAKA